MQFSKTDHETWQILFTRQVPNIQKFACRDFLEGFKRLDLPANHIPSLSWLNAKISPISGWTIIRTPVRYLSDEQWSNFMRHKKFPITNFLRAREELDFTPEPDIFHDIFGHLPMLMNPRLIEILDLFHTFYDKAGKKQLSKIAQLWWNTIEFGLLKEDNQIKAFGAGLMSSYGEIGHAVSSKVVPFTLELGIEKQRAISSFHPYFLINDSVEKLHTQLNSFATSLTT